MMHARGGTGTTWLWALVAGTMVAGAAGCGGDDDDDDANPVGAGSVGGRSDAGTPTPPDNGGSGGAGSSAGAGGGSAAPAGAGGTSSAEGSCIEGATQACTFDQLCSGAQTCGSDGVFGSCDCGTAALIGGGVVGARCETDGDCSGGATCLQANSDIYLGAGGIAGGYCSFSCTVLSEAPFDDDCDEHDPQSFCAPLGPDGATYCLRTCTSLDPDPGEAKCLNRPDLVCVSQAATSGMFTGMRQEGYCQPQCGSDEDCPEGRVCHAQAGICTTAQVELAPVGARCTLDTECSGQECADRNSDNVGTCTASCVLGALSGCGYGRDASPREAACLTPLVAAGRFSEGAGDLGLCRELCDVAEDCERFDEGWTCAALNDTLEEFFGRVGACVPG